MSVQHAAELAEQLSNHKRLATGSPCASFPRGEFAAAGLSFKDCVTAIWRWYGEKLRADVRELTSHANAQERATASQFALLLKDQRHLDQHANYDRATEAREWRDSLTKQESSGTDEASALTAGFLAELCGALECLCVVAARVARNPSDSGSWRQLAALAPEEEMRSVLANLGRQLDPRRLGHAVRQFDQHPALRRARSIQDRANVAELVALGVLIAPLRVPYDEILDEFGLIGDGRASALLLLAHGVQAAGVQDGRLISVLREVWSAAQRTGPSS